MNCYYDHFHAIYELDGIRTEIEGGLTSVHNEKIAEMKSGRRDKSITLEEFDQWANAFQCENAKAWGMPEGATIKSFWLAG